MILRSDIDKKPFGRMSVLNRKALSFYYYTLTLVNGSKQNKGTSGILKRNKTCSNRIDTGCVMLFMIHVIIHGKKVISVVQLTLYTYIRKQSAIAMASNIVF